MYIGEGSTPIDTKVELPVSNVTGISTVGRTGRGSRR